MSTPRCPYCGTVLARVGQRYAQATRAMPARPLGAFGYCRSCEVDMNVRQQAINRQIADDKASAPFFASDVYR